MFFNLKFIYTVVVYIVSDNVVLSFRIVLLSRIAISQLL